MDKLYSLTWFLSKYNHMSFFQTDFNTRDVFELTLTFATKYTSVNIIIQPLVSVKLATTHFKSPSI